MKACLIVFGLALGLSQLTFAESRGTYSVIHMDPHGSQEPDDPGWGFGARVAIPLISTGKTVKVGGGFESGNLDSDIGDGADIEGFATTQDFQRVFVGAEFGRSFDAKLRPHLGVNLVLLRQDETNYFVDAFSGELFTGASDSSTRLTYDASAGLGIGITRKTGLDVGVRFMDGIKIKVPDSSGSVTTIRPDYLQFYLGVTHRFAWPRGQ